MPENSRFDPHLMALRGRIGGHVAHARHDSRQLTASARAAFRASFEVTADPAGDLEPAERRRRAEQLLRAHYARLAYLSAVARRKRCQK
jgi:hypothetical protein